MARSKLFILSALKDFGLTGSEIVVHESHETGAGMRATVDSCRTGEDRGFATKAVNLYTAPPPGIKAFLNPSGTLLIYGFIDTSVIHPGWVPLIKNWLERRAQIVLVDGSFHVQDYERVLGVKFNFAIGKRGDLLLTPVTVTPVQKPKKEESLNNVEESDVGLPTT